MQHPPRLWSPIISEGGKGGKNLIADINKTSVIFVLLLLVLPNIASAGDYATDLTGDGNSGILQVQNGGRWLEVCPDLFNSSAAVVACRDLGYQYLCSRREVDVHGTDLAEEELLAAEPRCRGTENNLADCAWENKTIPDSCRNRTRHIALTCGNDDDVEIRLTGGGLPSEGIPEVRCHSEDSWSTICSGYHWDVRDCLVICRQMGYKVCTTWQNEKVHNYTQGDILFSRPYCGLNEMNILQCGGDRDTPCDFPKDGIAWMSCGFEANISGDAVQLCGSQHTCTGRCGDWQAQYGCQCDATCHAFNDCCFDFDSICGAMDPTAWPDQDPFSARFDLSEFECTTIGEASRKKEIYAISSCPTYERFGEGTQRLCEQATNYTDVFIKTPVIDTQGTTYKNIYCAICRGLRVTDVRNWNIESLYIDRGVEFAHDEIFDKTLPVDKIIQPIDDARRLKTRPCASTIYDGCRSSYANTSTEDRCGMYYAPITITNHYQLPTYNNPDCRICNGADYSRPSFGPSYCMDSPWTCPPFGDIPCRVAQRIRQEIYSLPTGFAFSQLSLYERRADAHCSELGTVYDPFLEFCRVLRCPSYYQHVENECVPSEVPFGTIVAKLTGGSEKTGRVELDHLHVSHRTCSEYFDARAASVLCRQLGYTDYCTYTAGRARSVVDVLDLKPYTIGLNCRGDETSLSECENYFTYDNSSLCENGISEVVVSCTMGDAIEMRIAGSTINSEGYLQMRCDHSGEWGYLYAGDSHWDRRDGRAACLQLGYDTFASVDARPAPEEGPFPVISENIYCRETDSDLFSCEHEILSRVEEDSFAYLSCGFTANIDGGWIFLCGSEHTCTRRCGSWGHGCSCDSQCTFFNDCCFDYADKCEGGAQQSTLEAEPFPLNIDLGQYRCVAFDLVDLAVVASCSPFWTQDDVMRYCEILGLFADITRRLPVYDRHGVVYANHFCALCNNVDPQEITSYSTIIITDLTMAEEGSHPGSYYNGFEIPRDFGRPRSCVSQKSPCADQRSSCYSFYAPVETVRNPTCISCRTAHPYCSAPSCDQKVAHDERCSESTERGQLLSLFDFTTIGQGGGDEHCEELGEIFDPYLEECRFMGCPVGYYYSVGQCIEGELLYNAPQVVLRKTLNESTECVEDLLTVNQNEITAMEVFPANEANNGTGPFAATITAESMLASFSLKITLDHLLLSDAGRVDVYYTCGVATFLLSANVTLRNITSEECSGVELTDFQHGARKPSAESRVSQNVFSYEFNTKKHTFVRRDLSDPCWQALNVQLECAETSNVNPGDFELTPSRDSVMVRALDGRVVVHAEEFQMFRNGSLRVCSERLNAKSKLYDLFYTVCSSISLVAMVLTFITYQTFSKLRNVPGLSLMNLVGALFMANLLFLFNDEFAAIPGVCLAIAAASHFFWLASFAWMSILSYNMARTFGAQSMQLSSSSSSASGRMLKYSLYAWGLPALIMCACLFIHFCDCIDGFPFKYGGLSLCWIQDSFALLVTFGAPVALILLFDLGAFLFTAISLRTSRHATKHMRSGSANDVFMELAVNTRLFILLGITWIIGFVQEFWPIPVWQIVFLIVNSLQGVFIFIMFVTKKRVLRMWMDLIKTCRFDGTNTTTKAIEPPGSPGGGSHTVAVVSNSCSSSQSMN